MRLFVRDPRRHDVLLPAGATAGTVYDLGAMQGDDARRRRIDRSLVEARIRGIDLALDIDAAIRFAPTHQEAISILCEEPFAFTAMQAEAVLQMTAYQRTNEGRRQLLIALDRLSSEAPAVD